MFAHHSRIGKHTNPNLWDAKPLTKSMILPESAINFDKLAKGDMLLFGVSTAAGTVAGHKRTRKSIMSPNILEYYRGDH